MQDFPGQVAGWVAGWLGGWLRKAENKAKAQQSWGIGFAELGKYKKLRRVINVYLNTFLRSKNFHSSRENRKG